MAITYTWTIESMSVLQTPDPDFVVTANWLCSGTDGNSRLGHHPGSVQQEPLVPARAVAGEAVRHVVRRPHPRLHSAGAHRARAWEGL